MRLNNLHLVRFGKFTDVDIALPAAEHDFHFIMGPNEAGKSTVRGAIADLLFGFPMRHGAMAFLHPQSELRLASTVTEGSSRLDFVRTKGTKNTLRSPADAPLPDDALAPYLGPASRQFFETMFGLSHAQLVAGGELVLDASKDVNQVLFQSAAGIDGLGKVREALQAEADKLWAPRHATSRSYYMASDQFDQATKDLKNSTVRTKAWADARDVLDAVESRASAATERRAQLLATRVKLERVRRLAPKVQELRGKQAELEALGGVLELPANASAVLSTAEQELSIAASTRRHRWSAVEQLVRQRDEAVFDAGILAVKDAIEELAETSSGVKNHDSGLAARQGEVDRHLEVALAAAAELGWPKGSGEPALLARLPEPLLVREVQRLVTDHAKLRQAKEAAAAAVLAKQEELDAAQVELKELAAGAVSPALRSAISAAQVHRNAAANHAKLTAAVNAADRSLETALASLGPWKGEVDALRHMSVPSADRLSGLVTRRQKLESDRDVARDRLTNAQQAHDEGSLEVRQFTESHHVVTSADVREARNKRDVDWQSIKAGTTPLEVGAAGLDAAIALADERVDTQLGSATEAAKLHGLRQQLERLESEVRAAQKTREGREADLMAFDLEWQKLTEGLALPGLALADAQAWMGKREQVLAAQALVEERTDALNQEADEVRAVTATLMDQLRLASALAAAETTLPVLLAQAETHVSNTDGANARREQLLKQQEGARAAFARLQATAAAADTAFDGWQQKWDVTVASAGLSDYVKTVGDAEHALARVETVRQNLQKASDIRRDHIDTMNRDLADFDRQARRLVTALDRPAFESLEARELVRLLSPQLREAEDAQSKRAVAEASLITAQAQLDEADLAMERANAKVAPLLAAVGVSTTAEAAPWVARSDDKRRLLQGIDVARAALVGESDGIGLDAVVAEVDACDPTQVQVDLVAITESLEQVQAELNQLAAERVQAEMSVGAMGGGGGAAEAEARRQEALAGMADASERYIKVTAAAKLLTWAIDRYREQNQGPMLTRAGAIFAGLTLGRYTKLFVDFDNTPPSLSAHRTDGKVVEIPGMSEGTRDQLYLALRLAALELHLEKTAGLPFIADDLFINFDDERSTAGLEALRELSRHTQVLFLSHHDHLLERVQQVFGVGVNVVRLGR